VASSVSGTAIGRIFLALISGFVVAVFVGLAAAKRLTKPLADAANAAHKLAAGERDIRLVPEGPTEISEIAEALNSLAEELMRSEGRQREFLTSVSHELRTPLTAIRGYAEGMSDGIVAGADMVAVGHIIESESVRLDRLVSDLLDLARTGAVDFPLNQADIDLVPVMQQAGDVWSARSAREGVIFSATLPSEPVLVHSDAMRVRQIIDNLAENALRVTPEGEHIVFSLDASGAIEVRDSGPGLTQEDEAVAFQPGELFERYRGVRKVGTGFGLALVGRLATRLGATASVGKAPEGGASFRIDFAKTRLP
jgi:two-component system sensor histidine kinase BaeS